MDYNLPVIKDKLANMVRFMCEGNVSNNSDVAAGQSINAVIELMLGICLPTSLSAYGVDSSVTIALAREINSKYPLPGNPRIMNEEDTIVFWSVMHSGYLSAA